MLMKESNNTFLVTIDCITFNHAAYIKDTMDGFCMQQTTFPFVCTIVDDASTDGEQDVIKSYLHEHFDLKDKTTVRCEETDDYVLTFARHKTNRNCYFAVILLKYNHYSIKKSKAPYTEQWRNGSKYIAFCEGDDYWIKPKKLQRQVGFLEGHPEYTMCFHDVDVLVEEGRDVSEKNKFDFLREGVYTQEDQLRLGRIVPTCSILMPMHIFRKYPSHPKFRIGDNILVCTALTYGDIWCLEEKMGVYRLVPSGWTAMSDLKLCRDLFPHYQGMLESFDWYRCDLGYKWFKFWTFSLLRLLKDGGGGYKQEFDQVAKEYKSFMGVSNLNEFWRFYYTRQYRKVFRSIFGERFVAKLRNAGATCRRYVKSVRWRKLPNPPTR